MLTDGPAEEPAPGRAGSVGIEPAATGDVAEAAEGLATQMSRRRSMRLTRDEQVALDEECAALAA